MKSMSAPTSFLVRFGSNLPDLFDCCRDGDLPLLQNILKESGRDVNMLGPFRETPLHVAVSYNQLQIAQALLRAGADVNALDGESGWTPLHRALFCGHLVMASLLLQCGADPSLRDHAHKTPYQVAPFLQLSPAIAPPLPRPSFSLRSLGDAIARSTFSHRPSSSTQLVGGVSTTHVSYSFGSSSNYQLGFAATSDWQTHPRRLEEISGDGLDVVELAADEFFSAAITAKGHLYTWGHGSKGRLGHGDTITQILPRRVMGPLQNKRVSSISLAGAVAAAVTESGECYAWGAFSYVYHSSFPVPTKDTVSLSLSPRSSSSSSSSSFPSVASTSTEDSTLSGVAALCNGNELFACTPFRLDLPKQARVIQVVTAPNRICLLTESGQVYSVGQRLSDLSHIDTAPRLVDALSHVSAVQVITSPLSVCVLTGAGQVLQADAFARSCFRLQYQHEPTSFSATAAPAPSSSSFFGSGSSFSSRINRSASSELKRTDFESSSSPTVKASPSHEAKPSFTSPPLGPALSPTIRSSPSPKTRPAPSPSPVLGPTSRGSNKPFSLDGSNSDSVSPHNPTKSSKRGHNNSISSSSSLPPSVLYLPSHIRSSNECVARVTKLSCSAAPSLERERDRSVLEGRRLAPRAAALTADGDVYVWTLPASVSELYESVPSTSSSSSSAMAPSSSAASPTSSFSFSSSTFGSSLPPSGADRSEEKKRGKGGKSLKGVAMREFSLSHLIVADVSVAPDFIAAVTRTGELWVCGNAPDKQGSAGARLIESVPQVCRVVTGRSHVLLLQRIFVPPPIPLSAKSLECLPFPTAACSPVSTTKSSSQRGAPAVTVVASLQRLMERELSQRIDSRSVVRSIKLALSLHSLPLFFFCAHYLFLNLRPLLSSVLQGLLAPELMELEYVLHTFFPCHASLAPLFASSFPLPVLVRQPLKTVELPSGGTVVSSASRLVPQARSASDDETEEQKRQRERVRDLLEQQSARTAFSSAECKTGGAGGVGGFELDESETIDPQMAQTIVSSTLRLSDELLRTRYRTVKKKLSQIAALEQRLRHNRLGVTVFTPDTFQAEKLRGKPLLLHEQSAIESAFQSRGISAEAPASAKPATSDSELKMEEEEVAAESTTEETACAASVDNTTRPVAAVPMTPPPPSVPATPEKTLVPLQSRKNKSWQTISPAQLASSSASSPSSSLPPSVSTSAGASASSASTTDTSASSSTSANLPPATPPRVWAACSPTLTGKSSNLGSVSVSPADARNVSTTAKSFADIQREEALRQQKQQPPTASRSGKATKALPEAVKGTPSSSTPTTTVEPTLSQALKWKLTSSPKAQPTIAPPSPSHGASSSVPAVPVAAPPVTPPLNRSFSAIQAEQARLEQQRQAQAKAKAAGTLAAAHTTPPAGKAAMTPISRSSSLPLAHSVSAVAPASPAFSRSPSVGPPAASTSASTPSPARISLLDFMPSLTVSRSPSKTWNMVTPATAALSLGPTLSASSGSSLAAAVPPPAPVSLRAIQHEEHQDAGRTKVVNLLGEVRRTIWGGSSSHHHSSSSSGGTAESSAPPPPSLSVLQSLEYAQALQQQEEEEAQRFKEQEEEKQRLLQLQKEQQEKSKKKKKTKKTTTTQPTQPKQPKQPRQKRGQAAKAESVLSGAEPMPTLPPTSATDAAVAAQNDEAKAPQSSQSKPKRRGGGAGGRKPREPRPASAIAAVGDEDSKAALKSTENGAHEVSAASAPRPPRRPQGPRNQNRPNNDNSNHHHNHRAPAHSAAVASSPSATLAPPAIAATKVSVDRASGTPAFFST